MRKQFRSVVCAIGILSGSLPVLGVTHATSSEASGNILQSGSVNQKGKTITGTVVDETGLPVIGANVVQKGTTNGIITDIDGRFSLDVPEGATLEISYIGYLTQTIPVGSKSSFQITLREDTQKLDEVVVVGFGTQKKANMTGAVATVSGDDLTKRPVYNVASSLQGKLPGLSISQGS